VCSKTSGVNRIFKYRDGKLKYEDFNPSVQFAGVSIKKFDLFRDKGIALKPYRGGNEKMDIQ
jgi:hypothetical protein